MTAPHADQLIEGYLARSRVAASDLPASARDELVDDMRSHIKEARAREPQETDATILNILDRLGDPAEVVAESRDRLGLHRTAPQRTGLMEIAAVVLLPFFWRVGVILLWWSPAWRVRDKVLGTVFSLGGYPTVFAAGLFFAGMTTSISGRASNCVTSRDLAGDMQINCVPTAGEASLGSAANAGSSVSLVSVVALVTAVRASALIALG